MSECIHCGAPFDEARHGKSGRRRRTCSEACAQARANQSRNLRRSGINLPPPPPLPPSPWMLAKKPSAPKLVPPPDEKALAEERARDARLVAAARDGVPLVVLCSRFKLGRLRVRDIIRAAGEGPFTRYGLASVVAR